VLRERQDRGITPTAAGWVMLARIRTVLDMLYLMVRDLDEFRSGKRGHIRLQAHMSVVSTVLPKILAEFLEVHPSIDVDLDEFTSFEILHNIKTGLADVGLVSGTLKSDDLHFLPWREDELVGILPKGHRLESLPVLRLSDMLNYPFIGMQRDSALLTLYRSQASALGKPLRERAHGTSFESVRKMVSAGLGVAILPAVSAYPYANESRLVVKVLEESWTHRPLLICVRDPEHLLAAARLLINHLLSFSQAEEGHVARPSSVTS
jgi:DNA-binding transcriptional LysR family regulator